MNRLYDAAAQSLIERGFAVIGDGTALMPLVRAAFLAGSGFFGEEPEVKLAAASPFKLEGYRPMGSEFSETPEQPDLCESFSVWGWNSAGPEVQVWSGENQLHRAMTRALPGFASLADNVLDALRRRLNCHGDRLNASEASYLQINHYRPRTCKREFLQEVHEDGHVLTIHKATAPGLEIQVRDRFVSVAVPNDTFLLLPGSLLTLLTGGLVPPLFHRVRNDHSTAVRQSLLYFVNPSILRETRPWIENDINRDVSIRTVALSCLGAR